MGPASTSAALTLKSIVSWRTTERRAGADTTTRTSALYRISPRNACELPLQFCSNVAHSVSTDEPGPKTICLIWKIPVTRLQAEKYRLTLSPGWVGVGEPAAWV